MAIKITTGSKKGISLLSTKSARELRPSQSILREALINVLQNSELFEEGLESLCVLDLYSGIGSVGFELLSNGAQKVVFVEKDRKCVKILQENIRKLGFSRQAEIIPKSVLEGIKELGSKIQKGKNNPFKLIFADPPYKFYEDLKALRQVLEAIFNSKITSEKAIIVLETPSGLELEALLRLSLDCGFEVFKNKKYGDSHLYFLRKT